MKLYQLTCLTMECPICLDNVENAPNVYCSNPICECRVCLPCFEQLIVYCIGNKTLPLCPVKGCGGYYYHRHVPQELHPKYVEAIVTHFSAEFDQLILFEINKEDLIEKVRNMRRIYLQDNFPRGIYLAAEIALGPKLTRINVAKLKKEEERPKRRCMNTLCQGFLVEESGNLVCVACQTHFCKECEKRIVPGHTCTKEDMDSVKFTRTIVKCPNCLVAIEKSAGCDQMTCAHCNTHFIYNQGILGGLGNHGQNKPIEEKNRDLLTELAPYFQNKQRHAEYEKYIGEIQDTNPGPATEEQVVHIIVNYLKGKQKDGSINKDPEILSAYCKYFHHRQRYREYMNMMNEIEAGLIGKKLKLKDLKKMWKKATKGVGEA